ncbi:hypothetical protein TELCIR_20894, partial [Teladorsagia circumcincta]
MRDCIDLVRVLRERKAIPVKYPLKEMIVVNRDEQFLEDLKSLEHYILSEVNIRQLTVSQDKHKYGITLKADPNFRILGARLKADQKKVVDYLKTQVTESELEQFLAEGKEFKAKLVSTDPAVVYCVVEPKSSQLASVVTSHKERIEEATGTPLRLEQLPSGKRATVSGVSTVKDSEVSLWLIAEGVTDTVTVGLNGKTLRIRLKSSEDKLLSYSDLLYE